MSTRTFWIIGIAAALVPAKLLPAEPKIESDPAKIGYAIGVQIASNLELVKEDVDVEMLILGIRDRIGSKKLRMNDQSIREAHRKLQQLVTEKRRAQQKTQADESLKQGTEFMEKNAQDSNVITTDSGLQYKLIKEGDGAKPKARDSVTVHYRGMLIDGTEFDSSYSRGEPTTFPLKGVIKGWTEGLQYMNVGSTYRFFIPPHLAYGKDGSPPNIPPQSTLIFDVELLAIKE
jgi:FKBP-type peptidyl-prolyl cis-trans isomerase